MSSPEITIATVADRDRIVGSLVAAFVADPVLRFLFPSSGDYGAFAPVFFADLFDRRVGKGTIWTVLGGASTAMWEPPASALPRSPAVSASPRPAAPARPSAPARPAASARSSAALEPSAAVSTPSASAAAGYPDDVRDRVSAYDRAVHDAFPAGPYWYLGVLGTHPDSAGNGWGRAVMAEGLRRAADDGLPAFLETSNPGNVEIYQRAGWHVVDRVTKPLTIWIMRQ